MPFVRIDLSGRTFGTKESLGQGSNSKYIRNTGAPQSAVHVIINAAPEGTYFLKVKCAPNTVPLKAFLACDITYRKGFFLFFLGLDCPAFRSSRLSLIKVPLMLVDFGKGCI